MRVVSFSDEAQAWLQAWGEASVLVLNTQVARDLFLRGDHEALFSCSPDVVVFDGRVEKEPFRAEHFRALLKERRLGTETLTMQGETFKQILDGALRLAIKTGLGQSGMRHLALQEAGLKRIQQERVLAGLQTAMVLNRLEPLQIAGRWVPDLLDNAGLQPIGVQAGQPDCVLSAEELSQMNPDALLVSLPGHTEEEVRHKARGKDLLSRLTDTKICFCDGSSHFHFPGPLLYETIPYLITRLLGNA